MTARLGKVIAYCRVSTVAQDAESQRLRIYDYARDRGLKVSDVVTETVSSRKKRADREVMRMVGTLTPGDLVVTTELSRLGRSSLTEVGAIIEAIRDAGAGLLVVNEDIRIMPGQDMDLKAQCLLSALMIAARVERDMTSERTKAGLAALKATGKRLGRPPGYSKLKPHDAELKVLLTKGLNIANIARYFGVGRATMHRYIKAHGIDPKVLRAKGKTA